MHHHRPTERTPTHRLIASASLLALAPLSPLAPLAPAVAAEQPVQPIVDEPPVVSVFLTGGVEHQFRSNIDGGGAVAVTRANAGVNSRINISPELNLSLGFRYDTDLYDFSGAPVMLAPGITPGVDPWDDIHTLTFSGILSYDLDQAWSIFGGPVFQFSLESGADWGDAFTGGGVIGTTYSFDETFTVGVGIGFVTQIEDNPRPFPIFILEWEVVENLRLTTQTIAAATGDTGIELVYHLGQWELGAGMLYRHRRFRLDTANPVAPAGVGRDTRVPLWVRIGYHFTPNLSASIYGGAVLGGQLRLESSTGGLIGTADYDPAGLIGGRVSFRF